jgi:hypothetical protein
MALIDGTRATHAIEGLLPDSAVTRMSGKKERGVLPIRASQTHETAKDVFYRGLLHAFVLAVVGAVTAAAILN